MRQIHNYGEKCFLDFAGQTMRVTNPKTGEIKMAQIFVACLGASNGRKRSSSSSKMDTRFT
jgi:transposase